MIKIRHHHRTARLLGAGLLSVLLFALSLAAQPEQPSLRTKRRIFRIGYVSSAFSDVQIEDAKAALEVWANIVSRDMSGLADEVESFILDNQVDLEEEIARQKIDLTIIGSIDYLKLEPKHLFEPVLVPFGGKDIYLKYYLLVHRDSLVEDFKQLKGKHLVVESGGQGEISSLWMEREFHERGLPDPGAYFGEIQLVNKASKAALAVFFKTADACIVTDRSYETLVDLNPQLGRQLVIISRSESFLRGLLAFRKDLEEDMATVTIRILKNLHRDAAGQQMLMMFKEKQLFPFAQEHLSSVRDLLAQLSRLKAGESPGRSD